MSTTGAIYSKEGSDIAMASCSASSTTSVNATRAGSSSRMTPEPSGTHAFVWELSDLCSLASQSDIFSQLVEKIVRTTFQVDLSDELNELNQVNVEDVEIDENLNDHTEQSYSNTVLQVMNAVKPATNALNSASIWHASAANGELNYNVTPSSISTGLTQSILNGTLMGVNSAASAAASANTLNQEMMENLRRIATNYRKLRATYNAYRNDVGGFLDFCGFSAQKEKILTSLHSLSLERYKRCLRIIVERSQTMKEKSANVALSNESLTRSAVKLLVLGLAAYVPIENIYSMQKIGHEIIFNRITDRFKKQYAVTISSNVETREFSRQLGINCWFVANFVDVDKLYMALDTLILFDPTNSTPTTASATNTIADVNAKTTLPMDHKGIAPYITS